MHLARKALYRMLVLGILLLAYGCAKKTPNNPHCPAPESIDARAYLLDVGNGCGPVEHVGTASIKLNEGAYQINAAANQVVTHNGNYQYYAECQKAYLELKDKDLGMDIIYKLTFDTPHQGQYQVFKGSLCLQSGVFVTLKP